jgi:type I restriction enzyme S subunit
MPYNEADTRAKMIDPALRQCGWTEDLVFREQTAGSIVLDGRPKLRPYLRKATIAPSDGLCSADMYPLKVSKDRLLSEFLLLELLSDRFSRFPIEESARSRMPKLNRDALFAWKMNLPSLDVQKIIVAKAKMSTAALEVLRDRSHAQIAELNTLESALLRAAFSGAL